MITDALLNFVAPGSPLSLIGVATTPSPLIIDLLGLGAGVAPTPDIIGNTTVWGDPDAAGTSGFHPEINIGLGTVAFTTGTAATLNIALQGAPDSGAGGGYLPGTYVTLIETGAIAVASLTASSTIRLPFHLPFPPNGRPRFLRLNFIIPAATTFTAGSIASALVTTLRDDYFVKYSPNNYVAA